MAKIIFDEDELDKKMGKPAKAAKSKKTAKPKTTVKNKEGKVAVRADDGEDAPWPRSSKAGKSGKKIMGGEKVSSTKKAEKKPKKGKKAVNLNLNGTKRATVDTFKGKTYLNIRFYFEDEDGNMIPTKKGIMLTKAEAEVLAENLDGLVEQL